MSVISRVPTIPLQWLICNFVKRTDDDLHEVVASLKDETLDVARRRTLFTLFEAKRQQLVRLLVLVRFLHHGQPQLDRLRDLFTTLDTREQMYAYAFDTQRVLETHVEQRLTPMWDVFTALHVMTTGSYRLLPKSIETAVGFKKKVNPDTITRTLHRLNDQLHIRLLGTKVPQQFTAIRIEEGMAYLTVPGEFEVGISLRMAPPSVPPVENETEESRINWRLFQLKILIGMERAGKGKEKGKSSTFALVNDSQIAHLLGYLNHMMFSHPDPIMILYQRCHAFCISLVMDLLYRQAQMLEHQFGHAIQIDYTRHRSLSLYYWRSAPLIPIEGRIPEIDSAREKLRLCIMIDEHQEWSVRHTPPLPAMEMTKQQGWKLDRHGVPIASQPSPTITTQSPFRITPSCLSLSRLFAHTLTAHAHHRLAQLHTYIPRICQDARIHAYDDITLHQLGDGDDMHTELHITLIAQRIIVITCESSTGRFLLTWKGTHTPHDISSNGTRIACSAIQRVLEQQQDKLNANVTIIGDILMELRSQAELEEISTQVELMGWIAYRHPALLWPETITSLPSHTLYIRLLTSPHYFLAITLSKQQQHTYYFIQTTPNAFDLKSNQPIPSTRGQMSNSRIVQIGSAICLIESCTPIPMMDIESDMNIHKNNIIINNNININMNKKSHEWDLLRYVIAYAERKIPSCVLARQLKAQHFEFTHHHRTIKLQRQWAPTSGSAIAYLQSIASSTQHDILRMQFTILQPSNPLQLTHQWIAQISHPAITLVSRYLISSNQLPRHIQHDVRDDLIPDAKIFIYQSVEKSSIHTFLHDLTCFLRMVNVALDVDAYNMKPRRVPDKQDQFPPKFFELQSIDSRQLVIGYPIATHEQRATITFKQRDIDRISSRSSRSSRSTTYLTLTFYPHPFPQRLWFEAEFNAHHNLSRLLTHIYHAYKAMGAIVQFMKYVKHTDMMAGFQYFPTQHFPRTVSLLPESSSRLRLLFRKSNETCTDLRMLHHDAVLQDFMAKHNAASFEPLKDSDSSIIDMTHDSSEKPSNMQPGLVMMDGLYSYLSQWYRRCAQLEWWKKSQRLMKNMNQRTEFIFVRAKEIELGIMIQFISHEILTSQQQSLLMTYWSRYVAVAPYPLESLDAYVRILCLPKSMLSSLLDVIAIHIQPDTSRPLQPRLILHLSAPLHLEWDQTSSILYFTLELVDNMGSQSMYLPLAYHERLNMCCIWEYLVNTRQKSSRWRITPTDGSTSLAGIIQWLCTMDMNTLMQWMMNGLPTQPYNTISTAPQLPIIAPQQQAYGTAPLLQPLLASR